MIDGRRFGPLVALVVLGMGVLLVRMFQVQVIEHAIWAKEAANLVRSGSIEPYSRGAIFDRDGRPIARDEDVYELDFTWRGFRRGHPLGQVVQMRSLLLMRPISLADAARHIVEWTEELVFLSPAEIDAFGRGAAVRIGSLDVPSSSDPQGERRRSRALDLHFYVKALLGVDERGSRAIAEFKQEPEWQLSYLELAARVARVEPTELSARVATRARESLVHLARLAPWLELDERGDLAPGTPLQRLVELLERARSDVEDAVADDLFAKAAGFGAWRMDARNLARLDLDWLRRCLYWDEPRLARWIAGRGAAWPAAVEEYLAGQAIVRVRQGFADPATRLLSGLAWFFAAPEDKNPSLPPHWREVQRTVVLSGLASRLVASESLPAQAWRVLPFQAPERVDDLSTGGLELVTRVVADARGGLVFQDEPEARAFAARLLQLADSSARTWQEHEEGDMLRVLLAWDASLQSAIERALDRLAGLPGARLSFRSAEIKAATEERAYVVRDRSARRRRIAKNPEYDLIHLVTRYPTRYAGFSARSTTRRVRLALDGHPSDPRPLAEQLVGQVRAPYFADLLEQRPEERELLALRSKLELLEEDRERIVGIVAGLVQTGESRGGTGIEGYFDEELSGQNGYRETQGLADRREGRREAISEPAVDGADLVLTLDLELQAAAEYALSHPAPPPAGELRPDRVWLEHPVGAIVLLSTSGDVLAAASCPTRADTPGIGQDGQAAQVVERTLRRPTGEPPGSIFKPFVAAWSLQFAGLRPDEGQVVCRADVDGAARYGKVHCHSEIGHSAADGRPIALMQALARSCNSYFAFVGEHFFDSDDMRDMCSAYGFGRPTGVRCLGERTGLKEDARLMGPLAREGSLSNVQRQRLGNGLSHIDVTPLQVGRAYIGLATGVLPELALVRTVAGEPLPRVTRPLPVEPESLAIVQRALEDVVHSRRGSAYGKGLDEGSLGFRIAAKTGSADYYPGPVPEDPLRPEGAWMDGMRKHTWVAGWFPVEAPAFVFVVYVHDTSTTSSHGAVYLAAQFLSDPALTAAFLEAAR